VGDLQKRILGHMLECTSELENTNHISKALGLAQPTIFKSIRLLEKEKYVQTRQENPHGIRTLQLTDKGVAAALLTGGKKDKIYSYLERRAPSSLYLLLMNSLYDKNDLDTEWMRLIIQLVLHLQIYKKNQPNESEKEAVFAALISGPNRDYVDGRKLRNLLNIDEKIRLIKMLRNRISSTNSIIEELKYRLPNEDKQEPTILSRHPTPKGKNVF